MPWNNNYQHFYPDNGLGLDNIENSNDHNTGTFQTFSKSTAVSPGAFTFTKLLPDTEYEVKIRAKNAYGWSNEAPAFVFKTSYKGKLIVN